MERVMLAELSAHTGEVVMVEGWVQALRHQGGLKFLVLRDVSGMAQAVVFKGSADAFATANDINLESVVRVTGQAKAEKQAPGGVEIGVETIEVLSVAAPELPIPVVAEKGADSVTAPVRLDWRWLDLRQPENLRVFQVWTELERGFREVWQERGYLQIYTPSFISSPSESGAEVFEVGYFGRKAFLAQSPQFFKQMAMASGFEKVFIVGPVFRAEPSFTTRHMTEFTGWDFELSFVESHHDVMHEEELCLERGFKFVKEKYPDLDITVPKLPFPKVTMAEAKAILKKAGVVSDRDDDFSPEEERALSALIKERDNHDFVFVIDYPITARPFYHMRHEDNPGLTKSFDLLYRGLEVTTGAQREHRPEVLEKQAKEKKMDLASIQYYIDFFRYGCPPHGGVGIGPGRLVMQMLGLDSVKDATFLPRDVKRLTP